jgi:hypothetical protein
VSTGIEAVALFALLRKQIDGLGAEFAWWFARVALATAVMAMVVDAMRPRLEAATAPGAGPRLMQLGLLALAVLTAAWAYALAAKLLRIPEIDVFLGRLTSFLPERLASWM